MKKILLSAIILLFSTPLISGDLKELEEIISTILENRIETEQVRKESTIKKPKEEKKKKKEEQSKLLSAPTPDETLFKSGVQFFEARLYENAEKKFKELKTKYQGSEYRDSACIWTAKIYIKSGKFNKAITELKTISENSGEYPSALFHIGEIKTKQGKSADAIGALYRVASLFPDHELADDALIILGRLYLNNDKGNQAIESVIRVIKRYNNRETLDDAFFLLGKIFERDSNLKDFGIARKIYKIFLKKAEDEKAPFYFNSPLKERIKNDLKYLEASYFKLEN